MGTESFQDLAVLPADGLGPDVGHAGLQQIGGDQDARLDVGADADDRAGEFVHPELLESLRVGGVGDDGVGEAIAVFLDEPGVGVDAQHVPAAPHQLVGEGAAEAAESDDDDALVAGLGVVVGEPLAAAPAQGVQEITQ